MAVILDGKAVAAKIKQQIKEETQKLNNEGLYPGIAVILVGNDSASQVYVANKINDCSEVLFASETYYLKEDTTENELLEQIDALNKNPAIHGILVQFPLPKHLDEKMVIECILNTKDVDAFGAENVGKIMIGDFNFLPCTPAGIMAILEHYNIEIEGKECVVVGRSNIVGKPMAMLLLHKNGTVTICHSKTKNLKEICQRADILVAAIGRAKFITADMVKEGAVVIDVGMNRDENGKLCGDVDFVNVEKKASFITPVPGGVGPMTRAMLLQNTLTAAKLSKEDMI